jgi:hypothetical protein
MRDAHVREPERHWIPAVGFEFKTPATADGISSSIALHNSFLIIILLRQTSLIYLG